MLEKNILKIPKKNMQNGLYILLMLFPILSLSALQYGIDAKCEMTESINDLQIYGERCSGTNYLHNLLWNNIDESLKTEDPSQWYKYGWKHFPLWLHVPFEKNPPYSSFTSYTFENSDRHLFIVIFRDPYDWVRSIYLQPHHTYQRMNGIPFSEFITVPWAGYFAIDHNPITRDYFDNVLVLRHARIVNMLLIKERVKNIYYIRYETLRDYPEEVLKEISEIFGIPMAPDFQPVITYKGHENAKIFTKSKYFDITQNDLEFINSQLDESLENALGFRIFHDVQEINESK